MKRFLIVCSMLGLLFGCTKTENKVKEDVNVSTMIDENRKMMLVYPTLNVPLLDEQLTALSEQLNEEFAASEDECEFNMSYRLNHTDDFISLMVKIIRGEKEEIRTFLSNQDGSKSYTFQNVFDEQKIKELAEKIDERLRQKDERAGGTLDYKLALLPKIENFQKFYFDKEVVAFYFDNFNDHKIREAIFSYDELSEFIKLEISKPVYLTYDEILYEPTKIIDPNKPMVALTFDDGPNKYTEQLLDALKEYNCSATFFVLGSMVEKYPIALQRMVLEGHEIGNHTMDHRQLTKLTEKEIIKEVEDTQHAIESIVHIYPTLVRPPYGSKNDTVSRILDYDLILWDLDTRDWASKDTQKIIEVTLNNVRDKDIILMHDIYPTSVQAAIELIPLLQERGYQLVTVSELMMYR